MEQETILDRLSKSIYSTDASADAYLFGSRARGDFHRNSDWDIIILINENKVTHEIEEKFRRELYDIELDIGQVISTFIYPKEYWNKTLIYSPLYKNVSKEGIKL
jgi:predicted nucleotidyltransferase